ncbi:MAG: hypothetical protein K2L45_03275 [Muribaculaceae bacterium]|nr:hypothetical protein [Muribaculaceae bacterium]
MIDIDYNPEDLSKLLFELEPKRRMRAVKSAFYRVANRLRKKAIEQLREERKTIASKKYSNGRTKKPGPGWKYIPSPNPSKALEKGIKSIVYSKKPGFRVTVGSKYANKNGKGERGIHTNRQGLKKPVLMWAETGTKSRDTKTKSRNKKKGHCTGSMPTMNFMEKTKNAMKDQVTNDLRQSLEESIIKTVKKYGKT